MCWPQASGSVRTDELLLDLLARASRALSVGFAEELRQHGLSIPMWRVLAALLVEPGKPVSALASACILQQPTMSKLLDRMERDGMVARTPDGRDRRITRVVLTPQGGAKAAAVVASAGRHEAGILARCPEADALKAMLRDIVAQFRPLPSVDGREDSAS